MKCRAMQNSWLKAMLAAGIVLLAGGLIWAYGVGAADGLPMRMAGFLCGLGGALAGLVQGGLVIFLAVWLLRCLNAAPGAELVEQTRVLRFFMTSSPLDLLFY